MSFRNIRHAGRCQELALLHGAQERGRQHRDMTALPACVLRLDCAIEVRGVWGVSRAS